MKETALTIRMKVFVESLKKVYPDLDYSTDSIGALNVLVESWRKDVKPDQMPNTWKKYVDVSLMLGAYVGECIIKSIGGEWIYENGKPAVQTDMIIINPFLMIEEGFRNGNKAILKRYLYCIHYAEGCEITITEKIFNSQSQN